MAFNPSHLLIALTMLLSSASGAIVDEAAVPVPDAVDALDREMGDAPDTDEVVLDRFDRAEKLEHALDRGRDHLMLLEAYAEYDQRSMSDDALAEKTAKVRAHLASIEACLADEDACEKPSKVDVKPDFVRAVKLQRDAEPAHEERVKDIRASRITALDAKVDRPVDLDHASVMREMVAACLHSDECTVDGERLERMASGGHDRDDGRERTDRADDRMSVLVRRCLSHLGEDRASDDLDREEIAHRVRACIHRLSHDRASDDRAHDAWGERDEPRDHDRDTDRVHDRDTDRAHDRDTDERESDERDSDAPTDRDWVPANIR